MMIGVGIGKAEEWEYLAQYAENMSTRWAQLAIELQARAATAEHDPIEIEVLPSDKYYDLDVMLERLLNNKRLYTASSEQLDAWASTLGLQRSNKGGFAESDESLRWRIQAHVDRKQQKIATVDLNAALNLKPGQVLTLGGSDVKITNVKYDSNGTAEISYTLI